MSTRGPVAIVGAGIAGLSCARALKQMGAEVRIFEKAGQIGGRCATRLWQGHLVDYGVQYFTAETSEFKRELLTTLQQFRPLIPPILNENGKIVYSSYGPRFYVLQGNNYLAHVLGRDLDVRLETRVKNIGFPEGGIECEGSRYRALVSAAPVAETAPSLDLQQESNGYGSSITVVLEYGELNIGESEHCYGHLLGASQPLAGSYCENHKSGRILGNKTVFVLEASAEFSAEHAATPSHEYIPKLARLHEELWKIPAGRQTASFGHCWHPGRPRDGARPAIDLPPGVFACGDSRTESTVEDVWLDGRRAAGEVLAYLAAR